MPFKFKLSKRLALMKASLAASAVLALACELTDPKPLPRPLALDGPPPDAVTALSVVAVVASGDDGNIPANTIDNNLDTRWSAQGDGQWIRYDLGAVAAIDRVDIAWYVGDTRIAYFDIQVSLDAVTWTKVFSGQSSGLTLQPESYTFPGASGRYVRVVGHGNSTGSWNSITEVVIHGAPALSVAAVVASGNDGNVPQNTIDNNLATRWSAQGDGQWIRYDLGAVTALDRVGIAWYVGDTRIAYFDIQVSSDTVTWTNVFSGQSSGQTLQPEIYAFPTASGRYVRIVGHGNSQSAWNSITEGELYPATMAPSAPLPAPTSLSVVAVAASGDDGNIPANTIDNKLATRWSANGDGQWIRYDLGVLATVSRVDIAWYVGDTRIAYFDIAVSSDAIIWTKVLSGQSSGKTLQLESYTFPEASGRWVRIVGHGNSTSSWNSITEVVIYGTTTQPPAPPPPVASVTVSPASASILLATVQLSAVTKDTAGNPLTGRTVTWTTSNDALATVSSSGLVTGLATGTATITATSEGKSGTAAITVTTPSCLTSAGVWQNSLIASQTGSFEAQFDATPNSAKMDGVVGLSNGPASDWTALATIVRFNSAGTIDARNGGAYAATTAIPYTAATTYRFRLDVNIPSHTYDIYVTPAGSTEQLLGSNFAFRTEQSGVSVLSNLGLYAAVGSETVCNLTLAAWTPPPPAPVASVTVSPASPSVQVGATVQLTATPKDSLGNPLSGRVVTWSSNAPTVGSVSPTGLVTGLAVGVVTVTATSEGKSGSADVTVNLVSDPSPLYTLGNGTNYYVSPSGSDANPCTSAAPCYSLSRVSQLMSPGDNAHFASGNYSWSTAAGKGAVSGTASALITYISDAKWGAKINGGGCSAMQNDGDYVQIINFDVTGNCAQGITTNGNYTKVIGNRVHDLPGTSGYAGILGDCCNYHLTGIEVIGNVVDNIGPLGGTNTVHGIYLAGPNGVIANNIVTRASAACIHLYHGATGTVISNNVVANCGRYGILVSADGAITTDDYTTVDNNIVVNVPGRGLYEYPATGCHNVFNHNIVYNNAPDFELICGSQSGTITLTSAQFDALFVNYTGDMNGDYHLRSGAVAIDAGTTSCASGKTNCVPSLDYDGIARPKGAAHDIGPYEHNGP